MSAFEFGINNQWLYSGCQATVVKDTYTSFDRGKKWIVIWEDPGIGEVAAEVIPSRPLRLGEMVVMEVIEPETFSALAQLQIVEE